MAQPFEQEPSIYLDPRLWSVPCQGNAPGREGDKKYGAIFTGHRPLSLKVTYIEFDFNVKFSILMYPWVKVHRNLTLN